MSRYGVAINKTFIVTRDELFRVCDLLDSAEYDQNIQITLDSDAIIKQGDTPKKLQK